MLTPNVVPDFTALRVAVVGDPIADHSIFARPSRLSREAPVIVMKHRSEELTAGGAANVARNLWTLGARPRLFGAVGRDTNGRALLEGLEGDTVDVRGVTTIPGWDTPTKSRIYGAETGRRSQQVLRLDREPDGPVPEKSLERIAATLDLLGLSEAEAVDAVLVSDYGYGAVSGPVVEAVQRLARRGVPVIVDAHADFERFPGVRAMTPNIGELATALRLDVDRLRDDRALAKAATAFRERFGPHALLVTRGNQGMSWFDDEHPEGVGVGASGQEAVVDVSGAGDTAAVTLTLGLASGLEGPRAMRLANAAAGVVVMEPGTSVCHLSKLRSALPHSPQSARLESTVDA